MIDYATRNRAPSQHVVGFALVVLLHALIFWAINSGLTRTLVKAVRPPVEVNLIAEVKPELLPPPPVPQPKLKTPPPPQQPTPLAYVPPADVPVVTAPVSNAAISAVSTTPLSPAAPPAPAPQALAPPPPVLRLPAVINAVANCQKPQYPSASRRLEEEGTVQLKFLVGVDGLVVRSEIEKTSGYGRLDEAARAALSKCQFKPGTVDGKPEQSWASMKYTWRLE